MYRTKNVLFGLGKGFCENYQHGGNKSSEIYESQNFQKESFFLLLNSIETFNYNFKAYVNPLIGNIYQGFNSSQYDVNYTNLFSGKKNKAQIN